MWPIPQETSLMENLIFLYSDNIYSSKNTPLKSSIFPAISLREFQCQKQNW